MGILSFLSGGSSEVKKPPPSLDPILDSREFTVPPGYAYVQRREPHAGISFKTAPDSQFQELLDRLGSWQEAPDPIRQSDFYAEGNKVHPWAQNRITSHLAIGAKEAVMQDEFQIGKLLGYYHPGSKQYAGEQLPSVIRTNITPAVSTTYGSQYVLEGVVPNGPIQLATGMSYFPGSQQDGYPY